MGSCEGAFEREGTFWDDISPHFPGEFPDPREKERDFSTDFSTDPDPLSFSSLLSDRDGNFAGLSEFSFSADGVMAALREAIGAGAPYTGEGEGEGEEGEEGEDDLAALLAGVDLG